MSEVAERLSRDDRTGHSVTYLAQFRFQHCRVVRPDANHRFLSS